VQYLTAFVDSDGAGRIATWSQPTWGPGEAESSPSQPRWNQQFLRASTEAVFVTWTPFLTRFDGSPREALFHRFDHFCFLAEESR